MKIKKSAAYVWAVAALVAATIAISSQALAGNVFKPAGLSINGKYRVDVYTSDTGQIPESKFRIVATQNNTLVSEHSIIDAVLSGAIRRKYHEEYWTGDNGRVERVSRRLSPIHHAILEDAIAGISNDGKVVLFLHWDGAARAWNAETGEHLLSIVEPSEWDEEKPRRMVSAVALSADGGRALVGTSSPQKATGRTASIVDIRGQRIEENLVGDPSGVASVAFSSNGNALIGTYSGKIEEWDLKQDDPRPKILHSFNGTVTGLSTFEDGQIAAVRHGGEVLIRNALGQKKVLEAFNPGWNKIQFAADGKTLTISSLFPPQHTFEMNTATGTLTSEEQPQSPSALDGHPTLQDTPAHSVPSQEASFDRPGISLRNDFPGGPTGSPLLDDTTTATAQTQSSSLTEDGLSVAALETPLKASKTRPKLRPFWRMTKTRKAFTWLRNQLRSDATDLDAFEGKFWLFGEEERVRADRGQNTN